MQIFLSDAEEHGNRRSRRHTVLLGPQCLVVAVTAPARPRGPA